jgi:hypothetical protein
MRAVRSLVAGSGSTSQRITLSRGEGRRRSGAADRADCALGFGRDVGRGHGGRGRPTRRGRCRRLRGGGRGIGARCALHGTRPSGHHDDRSRPVRGPAARCSGDGLGADAPHLAHPGREAPGAGRQPDGRSRDQPRLLPMRERSRCLGLSDAVATIRTSSTRAIVAVAWRRPSRSKLARHSEWTSDRTSGIVAVASPLLAPGNAKARCSSHDAPSLGPAAGAFAEGGLRPCGVIRGRISAAPDLSARHGCGLL